MQRYFDVVQNRNGDAIVGGLVYVYISGTTTLATLYADNGVTLQANPVTTNTDGEYAFYAANGTYTLQITATNYATETKPGVVLFDPSDAQTANQINFLQAGTGAVTRTAQSKLRDVVSPKDFGALGDGIAVDNAAFLNAKTQIDLLGNAVFNLGSGKYNTTVPLWANNISPTVMTFDRPSVLGLFEGNSAAPDIVSNDPVLWAQKYTKYDSNGDRFAHNVGGVFGATYIDGTKTAGTNDTEGTWVGVLGNVVLNGVNVGTQVSPDYDAFGSSIGVAGFARSNGYPGDGNIVCGIWGYAEGPNIDATTFSNLPNTNWALCGVEANIQINTPDIGEQSNLVGKGSSVGFLAYNYRTPATGIKDWTFGLVLAGSPVDNNYLNTNVDDWNGFYTGILIDKIKAKGIRFGQYFKNNSYGIYFPDSFAGSQRPAASIYLGDTQINLGQYTGSSFNNNDFWHNAGDIFFRHNSQNRRLLQHNQSSPNFDVGTVLLSVNYITAFGATTTNVPALASSGNDTNIDLELRPKGTGLVRYGTHTSTGDVACNGYIEIKDAAGNVRKLMTTA